MQIETMSAAVLTHHLVIAQIVHTHIYGFDFHYGFFEYNSDSM